jgi:hypothetical protein
VSANTVVTVQVAKFLIALQHTEADLYNSVQIHAIHINANAIVVTAVCMLSHSSKYDVDGKLWARHMRKKIEMLLESAKAWFT